MSEDNMNVEGATREQVIEAWGDAERRVGKFVCLTEDKLRSLIGVPVELLVGYVRSAIGRM